MPASAVLFDAVGTLFELREPVGETYARFARRHGAALPASRLEEAFARILGAAPPNVHPGQHGLALERAERNWWRDRVRETLRASDQRVRVHDFEGFFDDVFRHYAGAAAWVLRPGARALLDALSARGIRLGVISNFDGRLPGVLRALDILEPFEVVIGPGDTGAAKPDPRPFEAALDRLGIEAGDAVYVGDRAREDLTGAVAVGLRAIDVGDLATLLDIPALL